MLLSGEPGGVGTSPSLHVFLQQTLLQICVMVMPFIILVCRIAVSRKCHRLFQPKKKSKDKPFLFRTVAYMGSRSICTAVGSAQCSSVSHGLLQPFKQSLRSPASDQTREYGLVLKCVCLTSRICVC